MNRVESNWPVSLEQEGADRRIDPRKVLQVQARVSVDGEAPLDAKTADLSHRGVSITSPQQLSVGQECIIELGISVPDIAKPPALRAAVRYCTRLRSGQFRIGMHFTSVSVEAAELLAAALN